MWLFNKMQKKAQQDLLRYRISKLQQLKETELELAQSLCPFQIGSLIKVAPNTVIQVNQINPPRLGGFNTVAGVLIPEEKISDIAHVYNGTVYKGQLEYIIT